MSNIYVNCGGNLMMFDSKKETMDFFEECIYGCEGSERDRYTDIYFSVKLNLNTDKRCFSDNSCNIYTSNIDPDDINCNEEELLFKNFNIDKVDLLMYKANNCLASSHNRIYNSTMNRYEDPYDLYEDYLKEKKQDKFYYIDRDVILCFDTSCKGKDKYWIEEFPLKDYEYANKWLNNEIEYDDYLVMAKDDDMEL